MQTPNAGQATTPPEIIDLMAESKAIEKRLAAEQEMVKRLEAVDEWEEALSDLEIDGADIFTPAGHRAASLRLAAAFSLLRAH